jgi:tetratricopeptide (TPR) repeat protein
VTCLALFLASCASSLREPPIAATPQQIPALRAFFRNDTANVAMRMRLAEAERLAGQLPDAALLLEPIAESTPVAGFYLGLVREDQGRPAEARRLYERYLARRPTGELSDRLRDHLTLLTRLEQREAARSALGRESELATQPLQATVVGVLPFQTTSSDERLHPLATALAELLSIDLAQSDRLRVVERARVQALLDEIKLSDAQRADPAAAARSGRLLGAGSVVQGRIGGTGAEQSFEAAVVRVGAPSTAGAQVRERDALSQIVDVEKKLALGIFDRLGIQLTPAERARVAQPATRSAQALAEFGQGLELHDAGRFADASIHFDRAVVFDGGFALARQRATESVAQARAAAFRTSDLAAIAGDRIPTERLASLQASNPFRAIERLVPDPLARDASVEAFGAEGFGRSGVADIVVQRPAGTGAGSSGSRAPR